MERSPFLIENLVENDVTSYYSLLTDNLSTNALEKFNFQRIFITNFQNLTVDYNF